MLRSSTSLRRNVQPRGTSAVELAIVLPVLITIILGCADFARFAYFDIALANAVQAGAAWTMMNPPSDMANPPTAWQASIQTAVSNELSQQPGYVSNSLTVNTVTPTTEGGGTWRFTITATYPFQTIVNWSGMPYSVTMGQSVTMRGIR